MRIKKLSKRGGYLPLDDIKEINSEFLDELERVKKRLGYIKDEETIKKFAEVLLTAYGAAIDLRTFEREVDYRKKIAEIEARADEETPFRRGWWWRLIFQPLTNRAQDVIEERAALEADITLSADERVIEIERDSFISDSGKKLSKREMKRRLKTAIKQADNADVREAFEEPGKAGTPETEQKQSNVQQQGQLSIDDVQAVQAVQTVPTRRPRPPRSCRRA